MSLHTMVGRNILPMLGAGILLWSAPQACATQHFEKHFPVKGHPVVCIHNVANGRIEVKSTKNSEVIIAVEKQTSTKDYYMEPNEGDFYNGLDLFRHGAKHGSNYLYFDGHVETRRANNDREVAALKEQMDPWTARGVGTPSVQ